MTNLCLARMRRACDIEGLRPIDQIPRASLPAFSGVLTDIDDTLTQDGRLPACAYQALWRLKEAGLRVVPVTGRPAGWCDLIARQWPVDAVVGENGAFAFWCDKNGFGASLHPEASPDKAKRLRELGDEAISRVSGTAWARDQAYRRFDVAIDFAEDVHPRPFSEAERIAELFRAQGAQAKVSSIHVNAWFGNYDKLAMLVQLARERFGISRNELQKQFLYCGDSPNDAPAFSFFDHSVGVNNITQFVDRLEHQPTYLCSRSGGEGFAEMVDWLLGSF